MNILFTRKYKYFISKPANVVYDDINNIIHERWYDFSKNLSGTLNADNSFRLVSKFAFGYVSGGGSLVYLHGKIDKEDNKTVINISLQPNIMLVLFFYLFAMLFVCELLGINIFSDGPRTLGILILLAITAVLWAMLNFIPLGLKNTFQESLGLTGPD